MREYKQYPGDYPIREITQANFEQDTDKEPPWYPESKEQDAHYAVCPSCDNPIQIVRLYPKTSEDGKPYGRHINRSIKKLAEYNHGRKLRCPRRSPKSAKRIFCYKCRA